MQGFKETLHASSQESEAPQEGYFVCEGITEQQISQLIDYSNADDPNVHAFTSDATRFKDRNAFETWQKLGRSIYTLSNREGLLFGIVWFGKKQIPQAVYETQIAEKDFGITFAIRTYGAARGKGAAYPFARMCQQDFLTDIANTNPPGFWVEPTAGNSASIRVCEKLGYQQVSPVGKTNKFLMVASYQRLQDFATPGHLPR